MNLFNVLYYNYYLFYKNILKDDEPHLLATLGLSTSISFIPFFCLDIFTVYFWCEELPPLIGLCITLITLLVVYLSFLAKGKAKKIVASKPVVLNKRFAKILTVLFFLITCSFFFWMGNVIDYLIDERCGGFRYGR